VVAYDDKGQILNVTRRERSVSLCSQDGVTQLKLLVDDCSNITDVTDPRGKVGLVVNERGPGSLGSNPVVVSGPVLGLRWLSEIS